MRAGGAGTGDAARTFRSSSLSTVLDPEDWFSSTELRLPSDSMVTVTVAIVCSRTSELTDLMRGRR